MKKFTAAIAAMVLCVSAFAFGSEPKSSPFTETENAIVISTDNVSKIVSNAFTSKYAHASDVVWKEHAEFYFASFKLSNQKYSAAFDKAGTVIAVSRLISSSEMPLAVAEALQENYSQYKVSDKAWEMVMQGETHYYVTAENKSKLLELKCSPSGSISLFSKTKKKALVGKAY